MKTMTFGGFGVKFEHNYQIKGFDGEGKTIKIPVSTKAIILSGDTTIGTGIARCSKKDNFIKETGRKIALSRAIRDAYITDKLMKKNIWEDYFKRNK